MERIDLKNSIPFLLLPLKSTKWKVMHLGTNKKFCYRMGVISLGYDRRGEIAGNCRTSMTYQYNEAMKKAKSIL